MKVIGIGFLRTGTTSLKMALERLGYGPCYHMRVINAEPWRAADWLSAARDTAATDWDHIFVGYESTVGSPCTLFWRTLAGRYSDAKFILTVRDPYDWYDSASATIARFFAAGQTGAAPAVHSASGLQLNAQQDLDDLQQLALSAEFGDDPTDRNRVVARFRQHISEVRACLPATRLLVFRVADGWAPLCGFLAAPEPADQFPQENDRETFQRRQGWR